MKREKKENGGQQLEREGKKKRQRDKQIDRQIGREIEVEMLVKKCFIIFDIKMEEKGF